MFNNDDNTYEDDMKFENFEFSSVPYESFQRQRPRPPFFPTGSGDVNIPPIEDIYPPNLDSDFGSPGFNFPGGGFNPPGVPKSPPPNYIPSKNDSGVQSFSSSGGGGYGVKAVSPNSIRFCLYKYTYIWEKNGRNYWAFLLNVDRRTVSGFRWFRRNWVYFGVDLRRIDSFVCYRSNLEDDCIDCNGLKQDDISLQNSKKDYYLNGTRDVYSQTLASIDIPEVKEDFVTQTVGYVDDEKIQSQVPCVKARSIGYRITLEVTYPSNYDKLIKNKINEIANEASNDAYNVLSSTRSNDGYSNPLENFTSSLEAIPEALKTFSNTFNSKLNLLNLSPDIYRDITYSIRQEKLHNNWKPYFYNDSLY